MSRNLSRLQAIMLGLVVLLGVGGATIGLFAIGSKQFPWGNQFQVRVGFAQIRGVEVGTRVRVQGIDAGEVTEVSAPAIAGGPVMLRLRLDGKLRHLVRADASAQIVAEGMIGGKVVEINPGTDRAEPVADNAVIASKSSAELADVVTRLEVVLSGISKGEGSLGKLVKDDTIYEEMRGLVRQGRLTLESIQQDADALKGLPFVRDYVKDAHKLLVRPDCERNRQWFSEAELFEPGQAMLTSKGRGELDKLVPWLEGLKHKGSEVVVASFTDKTVDPQLALTLSQKQSEAVASYLKNQHAVQKMGWFSSRKMTPIGCGTQTPPSSDKDKLPTPRVEVLVFVPQS